MSRFFGRAHFARARGVMKRHFIIKEATSMPFSKSVKYMVDGNGATAKPPTLEDLVNLNPDIAEQIMSGRQTVALMRTSKSIHHAVQHANAVVKANYNHKFRDGDELLMKLNNLSQLCNIKVLCLQACNMRESEGKALASFLLMYHELTSLDVGYNNLGEEGARPLAEALCRNTTLTDFSIGSNELLCEAGLAATLLENTTLKTLDLSFNSMGVGASKKLAAALLRNTTITVINMADNAVGNNFKDINEDIDEGTDEDIDEDIDEAAGCEWVNVLRESTTLRSLDLSMNKLGDKVGHKLADALLVNTTLTELNIGSNNLSAKAVLGLGEIQESP